MGSSSRWWLNEASHNRVLLAQFRAMRCVLGPLLEPDTTEEVMRRIVRSPPTLLATIADGDADKAGEAVRSRASRSVEWAL